MEISVDFLLKTNFEDLSYEQQMKIKNTGRPQIDDNFHLMSAGKRGFRTFSHEWFKRKTWLTACPIRCKLYCWPCVLFRISKKDTWSKEGFSDLKNLSRSCKKHEGSKKHLECALKLSVFGKCSMNKPLSRSQELKVKKHNEEVIENQQIVKRLIDAVIFLAKQDLSFRGHDESSSSSNKGNYVELLSLLQKYDSTYKEFVARAGAFQGTSPSIQNDLISCVSKVVEDHIIEEVNKALFFSIQIDKMMDMLITKHISVIIRYVDNNCSVQERFIGFFPILEESEVDDITFTMLKVINTFEEASSKLVGQTYDGASVMAGDITKVKNTIQAKYPLALFTHCYAHSFHLILLNGTNFPEVQCFLANLKSFRTFFSKSPKRLALLKEAFKKLKLKGNYKKPILFSDIRWIFKECGISVIKESYEMLIEVFDSILEWYDDHEAIVLAKGLKYTLSEFSFIFLLCVYIRVFDVCEYLFNILQVKNMFIPSANSCVEEVTINLRNLRSAEAFENVYEETVKMCGQPKDSKGPNDENEWKVLFYNVLDHVIIQIENRFFDVEKLNFFVLLIKDNFTNYQKYFPTKLLNTLEESYPIFEKEKLSNELKVLWNSDELNVSPNNIIKKIQELNLRNSFDQVFKLGTLISTLSVTPSSMESSFSCLERIKSYMRSPMSNERLNDLARLSIEKELVVALSENEQIHNKAIEYFIQKERRLKLKYKIINDASNHSNKRPAYKERKSSAKNKIEVRDIEKKDLLNEQICGKGGNEEGTFSTFIDVNSEIEVKEEPLDIKEEDVLDDKLSEQVFGLHENQEKTFTFIDINSEIKINDVPSYIKEEEDLNDPFFEKIPGLYENQKCDSTEKQIVSHMDAKLDTVLNFKNDDSDEEDMTTSKRELKESEEKNAGLLKRKKIISQLPESSSSDEDFDRVDETCNHWDNMQDNQGLQQLG